MPDFHKMNEAQREAVMHGEGPMLVLAGPGSGKTTVITNRISYLIEQGVRPEQILVITFTKEAALSMQERFGKAQRKAFTVPVNFGTFHAIFYQIIKQSGKRGWDNILRDSEKRKLILPIIIDYRRKTNQRAEQGAVTEDYENAAAVLSAISYYKNTKEKEKAAARLTGVWQEGFSELLHAFERARKASGKLDFDDMVYECLQMLSREVQLRQEWQERFQYILVDETQDMNPVQYQVIRLLAGTRGNLFCVGDDDQSIYGFRGSNPSLMQQFLKDYSEARKVLLAVNYRSRESIVKASLAVIARNTNRFSKELIAFQKEEGALQNRVKLSSFETKEQQYEYLIKQLKEEQKFAWERTAVLFRTNTQMQGFASLLTGAGIPYQMKEKSRCIYDHFVVQDVCHYIQCSMGERQRSVFLTIINKPSRWISREAFTEENVDFHKLKEYYRHYAPPGKLDAMLQRIEGLERQLKQLSEMKPYLGVQFIRRGIGYEEYLVDRAGGDREKAKEWLEVLEWLAEDARQYGSYQEWLKHQERYREQLEQGEQRGKQDETASHEGVRLMTVHASKGLEFEQVYLPDVNEGTYPHGRIQDIDTVEEERRILYVAMTRAKEALELLFVTGTKERPGLPSRFLNPLIDQ